jgi:Na+/proline symporter
MTFLGAVYLYIGYKASHKVSTVHDYFLAGQSFGTFALTIALVATQLGGGVILGTSYESYHHGLYGLLYVVSISIGFLILAAGLAERMKSFNVSTTAELIEKHYKSPTLRKIASFLSILSLGGLLMAQVLATKNLMISLQVFNPLIFWLFWLSVIAYTMMGGLRAVVDNDIFQLAFIMAVFCGLFIYEILTTGFSSVFTILSSTKATASESFNTARLISIILIPACYSLIEQDIAQHIFAAHSAAVAFMGSLCAAFVMLSFAIIPIYYGMKAASLITLAPGANPLVALFDAYHSPIIVTFIVYGVIAAIISTADALLCAISSHIVQDFHISKKSSHSLFASKIVMLIVGIIAVIGGSYFTSIIDVIVGSYDIPVTTLFISLMMAYAGYKAPTSAATYSIIFGLIGFVVFKLLHLIPVFSPELFALGASALGFIIGTTLDKIKK